MYFLYFYHAYFYSFIYSYIYLFVYMYPFLCLVIFYLSLSFLAFLYFLSCVPSMFPLIHFGMSIIYSYHIRIHVMSLSIHILSIFSSYNSHVLYFPMIFIYFIYHIFISYTLHIHFLYIYFFMYFYVHVHVHISVRFHVSYHIHVFFFLYESTLLINWNHSN